MDRRTFLKGLGIGVVGGPALLSLGEVAAAMTRIGIEVRPYTVSTEEGNYVLFAGTHGIGYGDSQKVPSKEITKLNGAFLETGGYEYLKHGTKELNEQGVDDLKKHSFYKEVIPELEKHGTPMLFGDIPSEGELRGLAKDAVKAVGTLAAVGGSVVATGVFNKPKPIDRREFIKRSIAGALGLWGYTRFAKAFASAFPEITRQPWAQKLRETVPFIEYGHPEDIVVTFRNALIAEKLLAYSEELKGQNKEKPTIAVVVGSGHEFLSEYLKRGNEFCMKVLDIYPESVLKTMFGENYKMYYSTLVEVRNENGIRKSTVFEDQRLLKRLGSIEKESGLISSEHKG